MKSMTTDDRLKLAFEAAERGDADRCRQLLAPVEREIDRILAELAKTVATRATPPPQ
jgi:hypothetical protein